MTGWKLLYISSHLHVGGIILCRFIMTGDHFCHIVLNDNVKTLCYHRNDCCSALSVWVLSIALWISSSCCALLFSKGIVVLRPESLGNRMLVADFLKIHAKFVIHVDWKWHDNTEMPNVQQEGYKVKMFIISFCYSHWTQSWTEVSVSFVNVLINWEFKSRTLRQCISYSFAGKHTDFLGLSPGLLLLLSGSLTLPSWSLQLQCLWNPPKVVKALHSKQEKSNPSKGF